MKKTIELLKIGDIHQLVLKKLRKDLERSFKGFNLSINIIQDVIPLDHLEYNPERRQYNASKVLTKILYYAQNKQSFRLLGVMDEDIHSSSLNFVFGLAMNPKIKISKLPVVALISIARLRENFYGRAENKNFFKLRILKEAVHELGHTFSLGHCNNFCIMQFSNTLTDTDNKPPEFCEFCQKKLINFFKKF